MMMMMMIPGTNTNGTNTYGIRSVGILGVCHTEALVLLLILVITLIIRFLISVKDPAMIIKEGSHEGLSICSHLSLLQHNPHPYFYRHHQYNHQTDHDCFC